MNTTKNSTKLGFTLIELLLVIGIIAMLAVVVFVALNPAQRFKDARDARRTTDVDTILSAIHASIVDNKGTLPTNLSAAGTTEKQLGTATSGCTIATGGCTVAATGDCIDLSPTGAAGLGKYLKSIPTDPNGGTAGLTKYSVQVDANGLITVRACGTEGSTNISASR